MPVTRRTFLGAGAAAATALSFSVAARGAASSKATQSAKIPIGLELYSVRTALAADPMGTVRKVAAMGYQVVEFYANYYDWTPTQAKDMRRLLDDLGIRCHSTHNSLSCFDTTHVRKTIDLNSALGGKFVVLANSMDSTNPDDWKKLALETLTPAQEWFRPAGLRGGYHNHEVEFISVNGHQRPMEVIAAHTPKDFMLQLDVGTCVNAGYDPVAWINSNPGRINSLHLKDWSKEHGFRVLFGAGAVPWKAVLTAAQRTGGAEYFLIEQEGSEYSEFETAQRCLDAYRKIAV
jgi:sugar phosphate isomerase/epimerase